MNSNYFFCDLRGTYATHSDDEESRKILVETFVNNLAELQSIDNVDNFLVSIISNDDLDTVLPYIDELEHTVSQKGMNNGMNFSLEHIINNGNIEPFASTTKAGKMIHAIKDQTPGIVYFADDTLMNQKFAQKYFQKLRPDVKIIGFIPRCKRLEKNMYTSTESGLSGVNQAIESYIIERKESMTL